MRLRSALPACHPLKWIPTVVGVLMTLPALAGRPLSTDDAGANDQTICQVEAWLDSASESRNHHIAPTCGLIDGLELGLEFIQVTPGSEQLQGRAIGLKWAPDWATWQGWRFALSGSTSSGKAPEESNWHQASTNVYAIASVPLDSQWSLHLNLGRERNRRDHSANGTTYATALTWVPDERWVLFAELTGHHRGPATQTIGLRWWLLPEQLGLDLTTSRANATTNSNSWGVGLGWYGIRF